MPNNSKGKYLQNLIFYFNYKLIRMHEFILISLVTLVKICFVETG